MVRSEPFSRGMWPRRFVVHASESGRLEPFPVALLVCANLLLSCLGLLCLDVAVSLVEFLPSQRPGRLPVSGCLTAPLP